MAFVALSLIIGSCAALMRSCAAIAPAMTNAAISEKIKPAVTSVSSKRYLCKHGRRFSV